LPQIGTAIDRQSRQSALLPQPLKQGDPGSGVAGAAPKGVAADKKLEQDWCGTGGHQIGVGGSQLIDQVGPKTGRLRQDEGWRGGAQEGAAEQVIHANQRDPQALAVGAVRGGFQDAPLAFQAALQQGQG
jgi:hypothetical protein